VSDEGQGRETASDAPQPDTGAATRSSRRPGWTSTGWLRAGVRR